VIAMLSDTFYWVLNMSITATLAGMVVLLMRQIRHIPRTVIYLLWLLPIVRFIMPFSLSYKYSIMNLLDGVLVKTVPLTTKGAMSEMTMTNCVRAAERYFPNEYKSNILQSVFSVVSVIWLVIAAIAFLASIIFYCAAKSEIRNAKHLEGNIYISDKLLSPAVFGIFRPKIMLPGYFKEENMEFILRHEEVHIKRFDNLWRVVAVVICCLHWFNPFAWHFLCKFLEDMELSCDEKVLRYCSEDQKIRYAESLIEYETRKTVFSSAFGGVKTRTRIEKILSYRKLTVFSASFFTVLVIAVAVVFLTNAII